MCSVILNSTKPNLSSAAGAGFGYVAKFSSVDIYPCAYKPFNIREKTGSEVRWIDFFEYAFTCCNYVNIYSIMCVCVCVCIQSVFKRTVISHQFPINSETLILPQNPSPGQGFQTNVSAAVIQSHLWGWCDECCP